MSLVQQVPIREVPWSRVDALQAFLAGFSPLMMLCHQASDGA
jgi:hypothetical protein